MSKKLEDALDHIRNLEPESRDLAYKTLSWVLISKQPLTTVQLQHALAVKPGQRVLDRGSFHDVSEIVPLCAGLIALNDQSNIIHVHPKFQKYPMDSWLQEYPEATDYIGNASTTYLFLDVLRGGPCKSDEEYESRLEKYPLLEVAANNLGMSPEPEIIDDLEQFLNCHGAIQSCVQAIFSSASFHGLRSQGYPKDVTALHILAHLNWPHLTATWIERGHSVNALDSNHSTPLSWAIQRGSISVAEVLLKNGADPNKMNTDGLSPLHFAAKDGDQTTVQLLLDSGAVANEEGRWGPSPLELAALYGKEEMAFKLLGARVSDINDRNERDSRTLLSYAVEGGCVRLAKHLLDNGIDLELRDTQGRTALSYVAGRGSRELTDLLLQRGAQVDSKDEDNRGPLSWAAVDGNLYVILCLVNAGAEIDGKSIVDQRTPLYYAASNGSVGAVGQLLEHGANGHYKSIDGSTPLCSAAQRGHLDVVQLLLDNGAQADERTNQGRSLLSLAAEGGHLSVVRLLLDKRAQPDSMCTHNRSPLLYAAMNGHADVVQCLISHGVEVNSIDRKAGSPLAYAAENQHYTVMRLLLDAKATNDGIGFKGNTALSYVAMRGKHSLAQQMLDQGANPDTPNKFGQTPLAFAAKGRHPQIVQLLLSRGAKRDSLCLFDRNLLSYAAEGGDPEVIRLLLKEDVPINFADPFGRTPLFFAAWHGNKSAVETLLAHGATSSLTTAHRDASSATQVDEIRELIEAKKGSTESTFTPPYPHSKVTFCNNCQSDLPDLERFYNCWLCPGGFNMCQECEAAEVHCLDATHPLKDQVVRNGSFIL
ncbi:hypothetical protein AWENTII_007199 [Aspergillus wentii]